MSDPQLVMMRNHILIAWLVLLPPLLCIYDLTTAIAMMSVPTVTLLAATLIYVLQKLNLC